MLALNRKNQLFGLGLLLLVFGVGPQSLCTNLLAQTSPVVGPGYIGGMPQVRPVVPLMSPRPTEGPEEQERWTTARAGREREPMAAFLDSLKGSDAAIEVIVGQARMLTTKKPIASEGGAAVVAVADPTVLDFEVLPNPRMLRLAGKRAGVTDFTIVTEDGETYIFEVHVVYDLALFQTQLRQIYPDALIRLSQLREHIILEGQARSVVQAGQIEQTLRLWLSSVQVTRREQGAAPAASLPVGPAAPQRGEEGEPGSEGQTREPIAGFEGGARPSGSVTSPAPQVINLLQVPGTQQIMLQVRVAELNRTGLREIGADIFMETDNGTVLGTQIAGAGVSLGGLTPGTSTTAFGIFPTGRVELMLRALRDNSLLSILAEPNLVALNGQEASFLAGGEFPVPIQQSTAGGVGSVTVEWKEFGVLLNFVPTILDEGTIRLKVAPEVSTIDEEIGTTLVQDGDPIPGVNTRRVDTTVELKEGQTLVLAGLLTVEMGGTTQRVPGLGDLPYVGPLFSKTSHQRQEKELVVFVTPYLVTPLEAHEVPCLPGADLQEPNDLEFYFLNRIEGRRGRLYRTTTGWDDPWHLVPLFHLERDHVYGPVGFTE